MRPMSPTITRPGIRPLPRRLDARRWFELAADSNCEDVQRRIRNAIRARSIRVQPWPGTPERVRIVPAEEGSLACTTWQSNANLG